MMGIKAAATCILDHNGIVKSFENLGLRRLPIRLVGNDMQTYREGQYVLIHSWIIFHSIDFLFSYVFINFVSGTTKLYEMIAALKREGDILRRVVSNDDHVNEKQTCHCDKYGYFVTDIVDYTKPLTVWNKKITDPLYKKRL
jgi:ribosomal protein S6